MDTADVSGSSAQIGVSPTNAETISPSFPSDAAGYEVNFEGMALNPDDPRLAVARDFAFANEISQAGFEQLLQMGMKIQAAEEAELQSAIAFEAEKLGPKGKERFVAVRDWLGSTLSKEHSEAILGMLYKANQVEAMEKLMRLMKPVDAASKNTVPQISDEEYEGMTFAQRMEYAYQHSSKNSR